MKVFGIIDNEKSANEIDVILSKMAASFRAYYTQYDRCFENGSGVGHLCIADLEGGRSMFKSGGNVCVIICGRVRYNKNQAYRFIKDALSDEDLLKTNLLDAKLILRHFRKNGKSFVGRLDGSFLIAMLNGVQNELIIINDRYGMKPLYYYSANGKFIFASEVKAILATENIKKKINWEAWRDIFSYGYVLGDKTLFNNILSLPPASILTYKNGTISIVDYWRYEDIRVDYGKSEEYFVNRGVDVLRKSILKQTGGLSKVQVLLSGGLDSRAIVCSLKSFTNLCFKTLTGILHIGGLKDIEYANLLSEKLDFENVQVLENEDIYRKYFVDLIYLVDGLSFEHLWAVPVAKKSMAGIPCFDGIAGDIIFDEVHSLPFDKLRNKFSKEEAASVIFQCINLRNDELYRFFIPEVQSKIRPTISSIENEVKNLMQTEYLFFTFFIRNRTKNSVSLVPNNIVSTKTLPLFLFLENDLIQLCMSIPPNMKVKKQIYRKVLRKAFPEAMEIPNTRDKSFFKVFTHYLAQIVKKILIQYKFIKIVHRLDNRLSAYIKSRLGNRVLALQLKEEDLSYLENLIRSLDMPPSIDKDYLFREVAVRKKEKRDFTHILVPIASFCLWYNLFYKDKPDKPEDIKEQLNNIPDVNLHESRGIAGDGSL